MAHSLTTITTRGIYGTAGHRLTAISTRGYYTEFYIYKAALAGIFLGRFDISGEALDSMALSGEFESHPSISGESGDRISISGEFTSRIN